MMERISELLDDCAHDMSNGGAIFKWMAEATNRIQELQHKVDSIENMERGLFDALESKLIEKGLL